MQPEYRGKLFVQQEQAKELTCKYREALRVEKAKQENLQKLIKRQKTKDNREDGKAKAKSGTD